MPAKRKTPASSALAKKTIRASASLPKAPSPPPTRSSRSHSARKGPAIASQVPARRKPSPSPSPQSRGQSKQSQGKAAIKKEEPIEKKEIRSRSRSQVKPKGESGESGRVTRAVVEAAEKPKGRSRNEVSKKTEPPIKAVAQKRTSRTLKKVAPAPVPAKAAKGKKDPEPEESEEEESEEEQEESEEEQQTPVSKRNKASPQKKTPPKKAQKVTPQTSKRKAPAEKAKNEPRSTSRSRGASARREKPAAEKTPQVTSKGEETDSKVKANKSSPQSSSRSRSTSKGRQDKKPVETPKEIELSADAEKPSPKRQRRSVSKPSPKENKPVRQSGRRSTKGADVEKPKESKADDDQMETEETSTESSAIPAEKALLQVEAKTENKVAAELSKQAVSDSKKEEQVKESSEDEVHIEHSKEKDIEMAESGMPLADDSKAVDESVAMEQDSEAATVACTKKSVSTEMLDDEYVENDVHIEETDEQAETEDNEKHVPIPDETSKAGKPEAGKPSESVTTNVDAEEEQGAREQKRGELVLSDKSKESEGSSVVVMKEPKEDITSDDAKKAKDAGTAEDGKEDKVDQHETDVSDAKEDAEVIADAEETEVSKTADEVAIEQATDGTCADAEITKTEPTTAEERVDDKTETSPPVVTETEAITSPEVEPSVEEQSEIENASEKPVKQSENEIQQDSERVVGEAEQQDSGHLADIDSSKQKTDSSLDASLEQHNGSEPDTSPGRKRKLDDTEDVEEEISSKRARHYVEEVQKDIIHQNGDREVANEVEQQPTLLQQAEYQDLSPPDVTPAEPEEMAVKEGRDEEEMETEQSKSSEQDITTTTAVDGDITSEYVVINSGDVPPPDSTEVLKSLPSREIPSDQIKIATVSDTVSQIPVDAHNVSSDIIEQKETVPVQNQSSEQISSTETKEATVKDTVNNESKEFDILLNRRYIPNPDHQPELNDASRQFTLVSYNILADCHLKRGDYNYTQPEFLDIGCRHKRMMDEIMYLNGDIVCMQEVGPEYYTGVLEPAMKSLGYDGIFKKRTKDYYDEGEATFYKTSRFSLVEAIQYCISDLVEKELTDSGLDDQVKLVIQEYMDRPDVLIVTRLKCNNSNNVVTIGNIHVVWGKKEIPDVQCFQIASAMKEVARLSETTSHPYIVCGDFNSAATAPGYQLAKDGYLSTELIQRLQSINALDMPDGSKSSLIDQIWPAFQLSTTMKSAYLTAQGYEPTVTTCNYLTSQCVDYLFYNDSLCNVGILESAAEAAAKSTGGIPNHIFPSDHLSLKGTFSFKSPL